MTEENPEILEEEIRLDSFFKWIWRGQWFIILLVVLAGGLSVWFGRKQPETHTAVALLEVGRVWGKPLKDIYITVEIANSPSFMQDVASKAGIKTAHLNRSVEVSALESGVPHSIYPILIRVTSKTESADESVKLASLVADEIIARHQKLFDEAIAPQLEHQRQLESRLGGIGSSAADREYAVKVESELAEVKASNTSPISTEKTHLVERVVPGATSRPDVWRGAATAALLAAVAGIALACSIGYYKARHV